MSEKEEIRQLRVRLTENEVMNYSRELAKQSQDLEQIKKDKADITKKYASQIATAEAQIAVLSRKISTGEEDRDVECWWDYDYQAGKKTLVRGDTGEVVATAIITGEERQKSLGFAEENI